MKTFRPSSTRFRPWAITVTLGSSVIEHGAVGAVRRWSVSPGISVARFSAEPMNNAILRASSVRNSCAESRNRDASPLRFLVVTFRSPLPLARITAGSVHGSTVQEEWAINRKDQDTASMALDSNLEMRETVSKEKQCRSANLERAAWKFRLSGSAAWE